MHFWNAMQELRTVQINDDDEMEISDEERDYEKRSSKRIRYDSESLKVDRQFEFIELYLIL